LLPQSGFAPSLPPWGATSGREVLVVGKGTTELLPRKVQLLLVMPPWAPEPVIIEAALFWLVHATNYPYNAQLTTERGEGRGEEEDTYCAICSNLRKREARFIRWTQLYLPHVIDAGCQSVLYASSFAGCHPAVSAVNGTTENDEKAYYCRGHSAANSETRN
jgi:hypothetical protein